MTKRKRVALIGVGAIGATIADELQNSLSEYYELAGLMKQSKHRAEALEKTYAVPVVFELAELLALKPDILVEAAEVDSVKAFGKQILAASIDFIPLSVGGLVDEAFFQELQRTAKASNAVLYIPSGAIGGFDLMRKMALVDTPEVEIQTSKPPRGLEGAPHMEGKTLSPIEKEVVFEGTAKEAIEGFPQNINVAIATALATVGVDKTRTVITSDPRLEANTHKIRVENKEGLAEIAFASQPSGNPRSSSITAWSVISLLKNIAEPVRFF